MPARPAPSLNVSVWYPDGRMERVEPHAGAGRLCGDGVMWVHIDTSQEWAWDEWPDAIAAMRLPGYEPWMLERLESWVSAINRAVGVVRWRDLQLVGRTPNAGQSVQLLMAPALFASRTESGEAPAFHVQEVFFICTNAWLITLSGLAQLRWVPSGRTGAVPIKRDVGQAQRDWRSSYQAPDLAALFLRQVVSSWAPALVLIDDRLRRLTQGFFTGLDDPHHPTAIFEKEYRTGLLGVQLIVNDLSRVPPRMRPTGQTTWFHASHTREVAASIQQVIDRAELALSAQREEIRADVALLAATQTIDQIALSRHAQELARQANERSEEVQSAIELIATTLLVPALVAAFFAAIPGTIDGLSPGIQGLVVFALMAAFAAIGFYGLRWYRRRTGDVSPTPGRPARPPSTANSSSEPVLSPGRQAPPSEDSR